MKILNKMIRVLAVFLLIFVQFMFFSVSRAYAATSPTLGGAASYSILGGTTVTNTGPTTVAGDLGVYAGSAVTGFPPGSVAGNIHAADTSAQHAQEGNSAAFLALSAAPNVACTTDYGGGNTDLTTVSPLVAGIYCSGTFTISGNLTLSGTGVWIFRSAATIITASGSTVTGGDPCNVWWKAVSSVTLGTNSTMIGNILASTSVTMNTGASLNGRAFASTGAVTMDSNTVTGSSCLPAGVNIALTSGGTSSSSCPPLPSTVVAPSVVDSRRISPTSIFLSWGPFSGVNTFNVRYGTSSNNLIYNTSVTGFSTTINNLPVNTPIWVEVAASNSCTVGSYGPVRQIGGPGLPNTGFAPSESNMILYIAGSVLASVFALGFLFRH